MARADEAAGSPGRLGWPAARLSRRKWCRIFSTRWRSGCSILTRSAPKRQRELELPAADLRRYLSENIDYTLDDENMQGLGLFYRYAAEMGLIPEATDIE